jgi:sortase (surface protein transpeptidase)
LIHHQSKEEKKEKENKKENERKEKKKRKRKRKRKRKEIYGNLEVSINFKPTLPNPTDPSTPSHS